jgi:hypothetical protein
MIRRGNIFLIVAAFVFISQVIWLSKISYPPVRVSELIRPKESRTEIFPPHGYNISTSCISRPDRNNPRFVLPYSCPYDSTYSTNLLKSRELKENTEYSSKTCTSEDHCSYENVCWIPHLEKVPTRIPSFFDIQ